MKSFHLHLLSTNCIDDVAEDDDASREPTDVSIDDGAENDGSEDAIMDEQSNFQNSPGKRRSGLLPATIKNNLKFTNTF